MLNWKKAGMLTLILVIPALLFLWIRFAGENHYTLRRYYPLRNETGQGYRIVRKGPERPWWEPQTDTLFHTIPDFHLLTQDSLPANASLTKGKIYVAAFFFTRCPTVCPRLSAQLARVQDIFEQQPDVLLVSHTIDPHHDTPAVLRAYAQRMNARPGRWVFLTGDKQQLYDLAMKGYKLAVQDDTPENQPVSPALSHDSKLVLVDKEGIIRGYYDSQDKEEVDRLILEIRVLLDIYKKRDQQPS